MIDNNKMRSYTGFIAIMVLLGASSLIAGISYFNHSYI
ncbi:hypothetical protein AshY1_01720 [Candidatus Phytoplasma fraxini]|uniref:Uncharacterized protein n=1 Tax=Ash yellows phytoplasma TaxID=35780 RepID=A0ABZ2U8L3_ASHYP